jgi:uncharacterized protein YndB with AHSA1/START domain
MGKDDDSRKGQLVPEGDTATLMFRRTLHHAPERVWEAIATPVGLKQWLMCSETRIDGRTGGTIEMLSGPPGYRSKGKILRWEPPRVFEYEWNVGPVPEMPFGQHAIFRYELIAQGSSTLLTVTYRRLTKETASGFLPGTHAFLDRLEAQLDGQPLPDWTHRFEELLGRYPRWTK